MSKMSVSGKAKPFHLKFECPHLQYQHTDCGFDVATVDLIIPNVHRRYVRLKISKCGTVLEVWFVIPNVLCNPTRIQCANKTDGDFNHNTSKATALQNVCKKIIKMEDDHGEVLGEPQRIKLPFACESIFWRGPRNDHRGWDIELCDNDDPVLRREIQGTTDFFILTVDCLSLEKPVEHQTRGGMRRVTHAPRPRAAPKRNSNVVDDTGMDTTATS